MRQVPVVRIPAGNLPLSPATTKHIYIAEQHMQPSTLLLNKHIQAIHPFQGEALTAMLNAWQHWDCPRDYLLLREQTVSDYIYFVEQGSVRIYYYKQGKDITEWLTLDEHFFLSINSFFQRQPSRLIIQTMEPSLVWGIHYNALMQLADEYHSIEKLLRKMVTGSLILSQQRMESIQFETAQERYARLLEHSPDIINRVPGIYIASFLGITKETLSRIRSQR
jgi:CRP-like cAMP-binding protein